MIPLIDVGQSRLDLRGEIVHAQPRLTIIDGHDAVAFGGGAQVYFGWGSGLCGLGRIKANWTVCEFGIVGLPVTL